ncbi:MbtH family protein [Xenorhabdus bovienii]|uniref:MbtH family protein n=1 Tax=Xenorhabdus bovienii TaxID=40576 RepID=UPI0023B2345C|nr:MbtH family NRPS accessory protein [Xenorhabdus bovienii]MDE9467193.1 MbtH family NRPS accessory protein [Xenorhabdus bovienii]
MRNDIEYCVVTNQEGQFSIWPKSKSLPAGWLLEGTSGNKQQCLNKISEVWTDMRPKSLRDFLSK